jgi:hypothetical protein
MTLRNLVYHNFAWKLMSVLLAVLVWWRIDPLTREAKTRRAVAAAVSTTSKDLTLPVRVMAPAGDSRGFSVTPGEVTLTLSGTVAALAALSLNGVQAYVDATALGDARSGTADVHITTSDAVTVVEATPRRVFVERR